jgi:hypothetical protein
MKTHIIKGHLRQNGLHCYTVGCEGESFDQGGFFRALEFFNNLKHRQNAVQVQQTAEQQCGKHKNLINTM